MYLTINCEQLFYALFLTYWTPKINFSKAVNSQTNLYNVLGIFLKPIKSLLTETIVYKDFWLVTIEQVILNKKKGVWPKWEGSPFPILF